MSDALMLALVAGGFTWAFRYLPLRLRLQDAAPQGALGRFLAATGPAAIATLFVASALPYGETIARDALPLAAGIGGVLAVYAWRRSVVLATLAGSAGFGLVTALATGLQGG